MSDGNLRLEASANFSRLEQAMDRMAKKNATLEDRIKKMGAAQDRVGQKGGRSFDSMINRATAVASSYVGIHSAISLVTQALDEQLQLQEKASRLNKESVDAQLKLQFQTGSFTEAERRDLRERAIKVGRQAAGLNEAESLAFATETLSSTSGAPRPRIEDTLGMMEALGTMLGRTIKDFPELGGAALDLKRSLGETATNLDAVQFIGGALSQAKVSDPENLPNLVKTIAASVAQLDGLPDEMKKLVAQQTLAEFGAFQLHTSDQIGAVASTAIVNFLASKIRETGRTDLTPFELSDLVDRDDPAFIKKILGRSFTKPMQLQLADSMAEITKTSREIMKSVLEEDKKPIEDLLAAQIGKRDARLRSSMGVSRAEALAGTLLRDQMAVGADARKIVQTLSPIADPGPQGFVGRKLTETALRFERFGKSQLEGAIGVARMAVAENIAKEQFGIFRNIPGVARASTLAARFGLGEQGLLAFPGESDQLRASQGMLRELLEIKQAQISEQRFLAEQESAKRVEETQRRTDDTAKLLDNMGRGFNAAAQGSRLSSEEEN